MNSIGTLNLKPEKGKGKEEYTHPPTSTIFMETFIFLVEPL